MFTRCWHLFLIFKVFGVSFQKTGPNNLMRVQIFVEFFAMELDRLTRKFTITRIIPIFSRSLFYENTAATSCNILWVSGAIIFVFYASVFHLVQLFAMIALVYFACFCFHIVSTISRTITSIHVIFSSESFANTPQKTTVIPLIIISP